MKRLAVVVVGRGKVGKSLAAAGRARGLVVSLRHGRAVRLPRAEILVLAVPDHAIHEVAERLAPSAKSVGISAVVHTAGALGSDVLEPFRDAGLVVAQFHPLVAFARGNAALPTGSGVMVQGDPRAVSLATRLAHELGLVPLPGPVEPTRYHAAAAFVSNGAIALAAAGVEILVSAGLPPELAARALGPLLESTGANLTHLGLPRALTGPVRRGDATVVARHLEAVRRLRPDLGPLHRALVSLQLEVARAFPEAERAPEAALAEVAALLGAGANPPSGTARPRAKDAEPRGRRSPSRR